MSTSPNTTSTDDPATLDEFRATCPPALDPYWPSRIQEDRTFFGSYVEPDERFYIPEDEQVYRITNIQHGVDVFSLQPCAIATDLAAGFDPPEPNARSHIDTICALAGAIELGDVIHLKDNTLQTVGSSAFLTVDGLTLELEGTTTAEEPLLETLRTPDGPLTTDITHLAPVLEDIDSTVTLYAPQSAISESRPTPQPDPQRSPEAAQDVETHFIPVAPYSKWTFYDNTIKEWVENSFNDGETILNACAGKTELTPPPGGEIIRNDINTDRDANFHVDVAELAALDALEPGSIDRIIFDPPWTLYQSNLRYEGNHVSKEGTHDIDLSAFPFETPGPEEKSQIGHAAIAKRGFDWLLAPGGEVLELTFHGTSMPSSLGYERQERVIFDPVGEAKAVIGSRDQKIRQQLSDFS